MVKGALTAEQKKLDVDLWVILITTGLAFGVIMAFQDRFYSVMKDEQVHILLRTLLTAVCQFCIAGLGISIVSIYRKESFRSHGLKRKGMIQSILLCVLCFIPYIIFAIVTKQVKSYLPFQSVWVTRDALSSAFPVNVITMLIIATAWGFFEGFNYVFISDKINQRYPTKNKWLNWGAIISAITCILIHGMVGVTFEGFIEMISVMIIIYGMLMAREFTGNAWGCIFIFVFIWNAF